MKSIYIKNLLKNFFNKKKVIVLTFVIFVLAFGFLGMRQAYPEKISTTLSEEVKEYETALKTYDLTLESIQQNIDTTEEQLEKQETYCSESIFMQIDPSEVKNISVQYVIQPSVSDVDAISMMTKFILDSWTGYIMSGSLKSELAKEFDNIPVQYLSELISCGADGNTLTISVKHYDMDEARNILRALEGKIEDRKPVIESAVGAFDMIELDYAETSEADIDVQNTQNNNLTNLRNYRSSLADLQTRLVSQQTTRDTYAQENKPDGVNIQSPKKTLIEYIGFGIIAAIVIPFVIYALWYTISGRLKSKEELLVEGLNILATYNPKSGFSPDLDRFFANVMLLSQRKSASTVCFSVLGQSNNLSLVSTNIVDEAKTRDIEVMFTYGGKEDASQIKQLTEAGNCILLVEAGNTSYVQIEEQIQFCKRFEVSIWGCVVVE